MQTRRRTLVATLFTMLVSLPAVAQTRFCIGGDLDHLTAIQKTACLTRMNQVRTAAARFGAPQNWHFVVVCDESGWKQYAAFSTRTPAELEALSADTDLDHRTTFFRGDRLPAELQTTQHAIAYEIAVITLKTTDKAAIETLAARLLPKPSTPASATPTPNAAILFASHTADSRPAMQAEKPTGL